MLHGEQHSFFLRISTPATIAGFTAGTILFFWLINFHGVPGVPPLDTLLRIGLPDMLFTYSPSSIHAKLTAFGESGRFAYRTFLVRVDFLFPLVYGLFFVTATTFGFVRLFPHRPELQRLSLLPLATTFFDYAENLCFLALLRAYPQEPLALEKLANSFTLAKWLFAAISLVFLLAAIYGVLRSRRQPGSA